MISKIKFQFRVRGPSTKKKSTTPTAEEFIDVSSSSGGENEIMIPSSQLEIETNKTYHHPNAADASNTTSENEDIDMTSNNTLPPPPSTTPTTTTIITVHTQNHFIPSKVPGFGANIGQASNTTNITNSISTTSLTPTAVQQGQGL